MKDETGGVAIEELFGLTPKMYLFLVDCNSDPIKANCMIRNVAATISHKRI